MAEALTRRDLVKLGAAAIGAAMLPARAQADQADQPLRGRGFVFGRNLHSFKVLVQRNSIQHIQDQNGRDFAFSNWAHNDCEITVFIKEHPPDTVDLLIKPVNRGRRIRGDRQGTRTSDARLP